MSGQKALDYLKNKMPDDIYEKYISHIVFDKKSSKDNKYYFKAPNIFIRNWVKNKYLNEIKTFLQKENNDDIFVEIYVNKTTQVKKPEKPDAYNSTLLDPSHTFDSYVVGTSNEFAYASAKNVAQNIGKLYNPLFFYGGVGVGKTHLLHAIGNANTNNNYKILRLSCEDLLNDFTKHIRLNNMETFKDKYRNCDILLIDDIQFISEKYKLQEEFFHTFNELRGKNKQIVLTSDKKPSEIKGLEERLQSRFEWGLLTHIQPPELETMIGIIQKKCEADKIVLTQKIILYIALNFGTTGRKLESLLIKINAYARLIKLETITLDFVKNILKEDIQEQRKTINNDDIINIISKELNIKPSEIKSTIRSKEITNARSIAIYLIRELTGMSMPEIAKYFGKKDHSTISHSLKKIKNDIQKDNDKKIYIEELKNKIKNKK